MSKKSNSSPNLSNSWAYRVVDFGHHVFVKNMFHDADGRPVRWMGDLVSPFGKTAHEFKKSIEEIEKAYSRPVVKVTGVKSGNVQFKECKAINSK